MHAAFSSISEGILLNAIYLWEAAGNIKYSFSHWLISSTMKKSKEERAFTSDYVSGYVFLHVINNFTHYTVQKNS